MADYLFNPFRVGGRGRLLYQGALRDPSLWCGTPSAFRHSVGTGIQNWGQSQSNE